jgi:hypothetical protein
MSGMKRAGEVAVPGDEGGVMTWFGWGDDGEEAKAKAAVIEKFESAIRREESRLYGFALFFECLSLYRQAGDGLLETERKQFRNLIQGGRKQVDDAITMLDQVRAGTQPVTAIEQYEFNYSRSDPRAAELTARADTLAAAYRSVYPDRPMAQPFAPDEIYRLLEAAALLSEESAPAADAGGGGG